MIWNSNEIVHVEYLQVEASNNLMYVLSIVRSEPCLLNYFEKKKHEKVEFYLGHISLHFKGEILRRVSNSLIYSLKTQKAVHLF